MFIFHTPFVYSSVPECCPESPAPVTSPALMRKPSGHVTRSISHWAIWRYLIHTKPQTASYCSRIVSHDWWSGVGGEKRWLIEIRGHFAMTKPLSTAPVNQIGLTKPNAVLPFSVGAFVYVITVLLLIGHDSLIIRGQFALFIIFS